MYYSPTCPLIGAVKVITSAHLLDVESTRRGLTDSSKISRLLRESLLPSKGGNVAKCWWNSFRFKGSILLYLASDADIQLPKARTHIKYLVSG